MWETIKADRSESNGIAVYMTVRDLLLQSPNTACGEGSTRIKVITYAKRFSHPIWEYLMVAGFILPEIGISSKLFQQEENPRIAQFALLWEIQLRLKECTGRSSSSPP
jgi:hypothetical protein